MSYLLWTKGIREKVLMVNWNISMIGRRILYLMMKDYILYTHTHTHTHTHTNTQFALITSLVSTWVQYSGITYF